MGLLAVQPPFQSINWHHPDGPRACPYMVTEEVLATMVVNAICLGPSHWSALGLKKMEVKSLWGMPVLSPFPITGEQATDNQEESLGLDGRQWSILLSLLDLMEGSPWSPSLSHWGAAMAANDATVGMCYGGPSAVVLIREELKKGPLIRHF